MFDETFENADYGSFSFQFDESGEIRGFILQFDGERNLVFDRVSGPGS
jgi:hypothetical protein